MTRVQTKSVADFVPFSGADNGGRSAARADDATFSVAQRATDVAFPWKQV